MFHRFIKQIQYIELFKLSENWFDYPIMLSFIFIVFEHFLYKFD